MCRVDSACGGSGARVALAGPCAHSIPKGVVKHGDLAWHLEADFMGTMFFLYVFALACGANCVVMSHSTLNSIASRVPRKSYSVTVLVRSKALGMINFSFVNLVNDQQAFQQCQAMLFAHLKPGLC